MTLSFSLDTIKHSFNWLNVVYSRNFLLFLLLCTPLTLQKKPEMFSSWLCIELSPNWLLETVFIFRAFSSKKLSAIRIHWEWKLRQWQMKLKQWQWKIKHGGGDPAHLLALASKIKQYVINSSSSYRYYHYFILAKTIGASGFCPFPKANAFLACCKRRIWIISTCRQ